MSYILSQSRNVGIFQRIIAQFKIQLKIKIFYFGIYPFFMLFCTSHITRTKEEDCDTSPTQVQQNSIEDELAADDHHKSAHDSDDTQDSKVTF